MPKRCPLPGVLLVLSLLLTPALAQDVAPESIPQRSERDRSRWREDPDRLHRHWTLSMGPADYLRALERTGMRRAMAFPEPAGAAGPWIEAGPNGGFGPGLTFNGRVAGIRIVDDGGGDYYIFAGASGGGIWRSHSSTPSAWTPLAQNLPNPAVRAFAIDPNNSGHLVVCTGDPGRYKGAGVFVTWNGGTSWTEATLPDVPDVFYRVDFRLGSSDILVAAAETGIMLSTDGGLSWEYRWQGAANPWDRPATDLRLHPSNGLRMYAVASRVGFLHSNDGGLSWGAVPGSSGLPTATAWRRASLAISPDAPGTMAVIIGDGSNNMMGIWRTTNAGTTWTDITGDLPDIGDTQMFHAQAITFEPGNTDKIWAASVNLARTTDGGTHWIQHYETGSTFKVGHADVTQLLISPVSGSNVLWICNDGGLYQHTISGGITVGLNGAGATGLRLSQIDHVESRRTFRVIALQDNGELRSQDSGGTWHYMPNNTNGADGGDIAITDAEAFDVWAYWGVPWELFRVLNAGAAVKVPIGASPTLHYDPFEKTIYVPVGPDVFSAGAYADPVIWSQVAVPTLHPDPAYSIHALYGSQADGRTLYLRFREDNKRDLTVARWTGSSYTVNTTVGLAPMEYLVPGKKRVPGSVISIAPSSEWPGEVWVGFAAAVDSPKVAHTTDYGVTWEDVTGELSAVQAVYGLAPTPFDPRTVYAATDIGVFRTTDGGQSWQPFQTGMPIVQCKDLKFVVDETSAGNHRLVAATYGRALWTRDVASRPIVYVDKTNNGAEDGSSEHPYNTVGEGVAAAPAGAIVAVRSNTYVEPQTVSKNLLIMTWAGKTTIR